MGNFLSAVTNIFSANTKARSAEVNANFAQVIALLNSYSYDAKHGVLFTQTVAKTDTDYTVLDTDGYSFIEVTTSASARTITLPTLADNVGRVLSIQKIDSGAGTVVIDGEGSEAIDGAATLTLTNQFDGAIIQATATGWRTLARNYAATSTLQGLLSTAAQTIAGAKTFTSTTTISANLVVDTNTFVVDSSNNVIGIGTASPNSAVRVNVVGAGTTSATSTLIVQNSTPTTLFQVRDDANIFMFANLTIDTSLVFVDAANDQVVFGSAAPSANVRFTCIGAGATSGTSSAIFRNSTPASICLMRNDLAFYTNSGVVDGALSDIRMKEEIKDIKNALEKICQLRPVQFKWKKPLYHKNESQAGFIAQEVQKVEPKWVQEAPAEFSPEEIEAYAPDAKENPVLTTQFADLQAYMVASIQEIAARLTALEAKVAG